MLQVTDMATKPLSTQPESTHEAVLMHLRQQNELTVAELCEKLGITSMAVRRHLVGLQKNGLVECRLVKQPRGRPTYRYRLTAKAESLFPSAMNSLAFEMIDAVYEQSGHKGVTELLKIRDAWLSRKLQPLLERMTLAEKVAEVARIFSENGYMTDWKSLPDGNFFIYQHHCAVHQLATKYRQICALEPQLMQTLLAVLVTRQQYMLNNDPVCGYLVDASQPRGPQAGGDDA
jgi:predicted ArsR family transcriptional regulator